ncbi:hypothetical protein CASFOL_029102 [Castilleja foliolosa]|uniref:S-protein homolog n=1 Tax=Castilleja foliolosa TaxID=1961234 RepID=A0ABD3CEM3_9LAMI
MTNTMMKVIIFVLLLDISQTFVSACFIEKTIHVHITNDLPLDTTPLRLHCRSDDLGYQTLFDMLKATPTHHYWSVRDAGIYYYDPNEKRFIRKYIWKIVQARVL